MTISSVDLLPAAPGIYALALRLAEPLTLTIRRQFYSLPSGIYIYVGSAYGPGGIRARLGRHLRSVGRPHWHIDSVRAVAEIIGWHYARRSASYECKWAQTLAARADTTIPVPGFGASDCRSGCAAHLIQLPLNVAVPSIWRDLVL